MEMVSSSPFSTYLSLVVSSSLAELVSTISRETPAPFCLGHRNWRRISLSLDFSIVKRVWIFLSSFRLPSWDAYFALSYR